MAPTPKPYPPTTRSEPPATDPAIARLQSQIKWLIAGLVGMLMLIIAMGAFTSYVALHEFEAAATQEYLEQKQLDLLRQIQSDFNARETDPPQNSLEAYGQLRESLGVLQDLYGPMADYDITDPDGSLDRIFEKFEESQRNRGGDSQGNDDGQ